jgi:two-component system sensor histidine kinase UhpB
VAVTNGARQAGATRVQLGLTRTSERIVLSVRDDGRGLTQEDLVAAHGIRGMRERAMLVGAELSIAGQPGDGTHVQLSIPLAHDGPAEDAHPRR